MARKKLTEYEMAATMAQYAMIQDVYMESCSAETLDSRVDLEDREDNHVDVETSVFTEANYEAKEHTIWVKAECKALFIKDPDKLLKKKKALSINVTFMLVYEYLVKGGPTEREFDKYLRAFSNVNGVFNVWPYFREFVQTTTTRMGVPAYILPTYRVDDV